MGKKKGRRQSDPGRDEAESTDDENQEEPEPHTSCPHTGKAVALGCIKKNLKIAWVRVGQCAVCLREKKMANRPTPLPKDKPGGGKKTLQEQKREQLERARQEQVKAAAKMKLVAQKESEKEQEASSEKEKEDDKLGKSEGNAGVGGKVEGPAVPASVWLCLRCGSQACGSTTSGHSLGHYNTPRSELHCLFVNTTSWEIFCFECNKVIYVDSHKKLYEAVEFIKKTNTKPNKTTTKVIPSLSLPKLTGKEAKDQANMALQSGLLPKVKGLNNLGNTCFFNSVMQCLSQTHPLTQHIDMQTNKGANLYIQVLDTTDSILSEDENDNICSFAVPEISLQLAEGGPMMTSLAAFLKDIHSASKSPTISPSHLFGQVVKQSPKFRGMQQQDSQELLRYLMDGLRSEETKRQKSAILKYFGLSEKTDPAGVPKSLRKKLKLYSRTGHHTLLDKLFSGQMVSTIVCEECHFSSQTYEPFLDLSLPVVEDKPHKPRGGGVRSPGGVGGDRTVGVAKALPDDEDDVRVTCCGVQEDKKSKGQIKKEKLRKKKESRKNRKHESNGEEGKIEQELVEDETKETKEEEAKEVDNSKEKESVITEKEETKSIPNPESRVESNTQPAPNEPKPETISKPPTPATTASVTRREDVHTSWKDGNDEDEEEEGYEEGEEGWEWDDGETWEEEGEGNKAEELEPEEENSIEPSVEEEKVAEPRVPLKSLNPLPPEMINPDFEHEKSSERTGENTDNETGASSNADIEDNDTDENRKSWTSSNKVLESISGLSPVSMNPLNLDPHMEQLCKGIKLLRTEENGSDQSTNYHTAESEQRGDGGDRKAWSEDKTARLRNEWTARTLVSLAPRYESKPGECSVYSCLNQFTQSELLTGSNKWACDSCTSNRDKEAETDSGNSDAPRKMMYSNASKQFLIFAPPMILTLHLKRFQQTLMGCRKINKHVSFPLTLDLAPFCSSTSLAMPFMQPNQTKVLYSLYGVVEHSGRLQGGHYTAFVKVRAAERDTPDFFSPPLSKPTDIPRFLQNIQAKHSLDAASPVDEEASAGHPRRWFHVSDTSVTEVNEDKVLKAQAYLLFYQRIL